jgi:hypothetical protein
MIGLLCPDKFKDSHQRRKPGSCSVNRLSMISVATTGRHLPKTLGRPETGSETECR